MLLQRNSQIWTRHGGPNMHFCKPYLKTVWFLAALQPYKPPSHVQGRRSRRQRDRVWQGEPSIASMPTAFTIASVHLGLSLLNDRIQKECQRFTKRSSKSPTSIRFVYTILRRILIWSLKSFIIWKSYNFLFSTNFFFKSNIKFLLDLIHLTNIINWFIRAKSWLEITFKLFKLSFKKSKR